MISAKALQSALFTAKWSQSRDRLAPGRPKARREPSHLSVDTDLFVDGAPAAPALIDAEASPQSRAESPNAPLSPSLLQVADDATIGDAPFTLKLASWQRDVALPGGCLPDMSQTRITHQPSGARLMHNAQGRVVLMVSDGGSQHNTSGLRDLLTFGLTRQATRLGQDAVTGKLTRTRVGGKKVTLRSGTYAFVIDQDNDVLLSLTASAEQGAPAGAHLNLAAGLPVLFAGELTMLDGAVSSYTPMSGSYRTPVCQLPVADAHPLLQGASLQAPADWQDAIAQNPAKA